MAPFRRAAANDIGFWGYLIYLVVLLSALASPAEADRFLAAAGMGHGHDRERTCFKLPPTVDAVAFIFEYLFGVYIQVYLITVCLAWIKGLSFSEGDLFRFAVRRFSYVLKWAGIVVIVEHAHRAAAAAPGLFRRSCPDVLDYLPVERFLMSALIIAFCSVQISLVLHNETSARRLPRASGNLFGRNLFRFGWFLLICALHYFFLIACDAIVRGAIADRLVGVIVWKIIYVCRARTCHRLAARVLGLSFPPMRNAAGRTRKPGSNPSIRY